MLLLPLLALVVHVLHDGEREGLCLLVRMRSARHILDALVKPRITEGNGRIAAVEELVDGLPLLQPRERAILPEDGRRVRERALQTVVAVHEGAMAKFKAFVEDFPKLILVPARRERHVHEVDGDDALIEAAVILGLAVLVHIRGQEAAAAHAGIAVPLAVLVDLILEHLLFGDVIGHHALCGASCGELRKIPILAPFAHVVLFEDVDELGEGGRHPHARFVLDALDALVERLFDDEGKVCALLFAARLAEIHEHRHEGRLPVGGEQRHDLILDGLDALLDLLAQPLFGDLVDGVLILRADGGKLFLDLPPDLLTADVHEGRKVRQRDALPAVLVGSDLRDDLRRDVARRRERVRLLDERPRNDGAVLQHILEVDEVAVVHVLGKVVGVVEVDEPFVVRRHDVGRQQNAAREVLAHFARHIVALHRIDGGILVGIFLLDFLVVALDEREDLRVRRVGAADERTRIAVGDILARDGERLFVHDLVLDEVLHFLDVDRAVEIVCKRRDFLGDLVDLLFGEAVVLTHFVVRLADGVCDLFGVERDFRSVSFDDLHTLRPSLFSLCALVP